MIEDGTPHTPQSGPATIAPKITKEESRLNFSNGAEGIVNAVRAFTYEPGAWCLWHNESFKITAAAADSHHKIAVGHIVVSEKRVFVGCGGDSAIELLSVVPAGKKEMSAIDWARGARLLGGENFG
jgi:methionyl-tRNA formyltransferase